MPALRFRFDPLFGKVSFEKAGKFIAIFDLVICCLFILSHFVGGGYVYEERSLEYETELSKAVRERDPAGYGVTTKPGSHESAKPVSVITYEDYGKLTKIGVPSTDILIILLMCFLLFGFIHICMEVWMCRLMLKAAGHKDGSALKTWFWCRLAVTVIFTLLSIAGIMSFRSDFLDWTFLMVNLYRIYSLYIVFEFKSHISACTSVAKPIEM